MSIIADFKKRQDASKAKSAEQAKADVKAATQADTTKAKPNQALVLLAKLLNTSEDNAIALAEQYIADGKEIITVDMVENLTVDESGELVEETADDVAESLSESASEASLAASDMEDSAHQASNAADELQATTDELKEVVEDAKKSSAKPEQAQKSSNGESKGKQSKNSNK